MAATADNAIYAIQDASDAGLAMLKQDTRFNLHPPQGTFYLFPNIERTGLSSASLTAHLLEAAGVAATSGAVFGSAGEGHIRLNLVGPLAAIVAGTKALLQGMPA